MGLHPLVQCQVVRASLRPAENAASLSYALQEGDLFGGIDSSLSASLREVAIAEGDARLFEIGRSGFDSLRHHRPELALELASAAFRASAFRLCATLIEVAAPRSAGPAAQTPLDANSFP